MERVFVSKLAQGRFTVPIVVAATLTIMTVSELSYQQRYRITATGTGVVDARINALDTARWLSETELGARAYAASGDPKDREIYEQGLEKVEISLSQTMVNLDRIGIVDRSHHDTLRRMLDERLATLAAWVLATQEGRLADAQALTRNDQGRRLRDDFRARFSTLLDGVEKEHQEARASLRNAQANDRVLLHGVTFLAGLALVLLMRQVNRDRQEREQARLRLADEVRARTAELRELAGHLVTAQEDERARLARELHDELGSLLTASKLDLMRLRRALESSPAVLDRVNSLEVQINKGIALKRNIIEALRPSSLEHLGLTASLSVLCEESSATLGIPVHATIAAVALGRDARLAVYRVVQEALTNISKYAKASEVRITLTQAGDRVEISVVNDGVGFDTASIQLARHGLRGMKVRVESLGGDFDIHSAPGQGTRLRASSAHQPGSRVSQRGRPGLRRIGSANLVAPATGRGRFRNPPPFGLTTSYARASARLAD